MVLEFNTLEAKMVLVQVKEQEPNPIVHQVQKSSYLYSYFLFSGHIFNFLVQTPLFMFVRQISLERSHPTTIHTQKKKN